MRSFLLRLTVFGTVFFLLDKLFLLPLFIAPSLEVDDRLEKVLKGELNRDIIVMGSSRGARNIIAGQLEDSLGLTAFNLSYPGSDIEFHEFLLRTLVGHNRPPKLILLALDDPNELLPSEALRFRLDRLYPLGLYDAVNEEMIERRERSLLARYFALSRLSPKNFDPRKRRFSELDTIISCGSMPISFERKDRDFLTDGQNGDYDKSAELPTKVKAFQQFQTRCQSYGIKLLLVFSPNLFEHDRLFEARMRELSLPEVRFHVFDRQTPAYHERSYYFDEKHLQTKGAVIFTQEVLKAVRADLLPVSMLPTTGLPSVGTGN